MKQEILVKVEHMNKRFGSTVALKDVSIEVCSGRVLGLIGENGSGKSTVTSIIAGMQNADSGTMTYHDKEWKPESMLYSLEHGIGMIVQETGTVPGITVAENIFLGETKFFKSFGEKHKWGPVKRKLLNQKAQEALDAIGASHIRAEQMTASLTLDLYGEDVYQYAGNTIAITYQAKVNEKAKVNFDSDENKATLKYSTVASGTDMSDPMQDITHHYTFGFDTLVNGTGSEKTTEITKYGVKTTTELDNKVALDGAQFKLFDANGKQLYFTSDGEYTTETSGTYDYIVSKNNGQLTATGLDAGTYTLKESKAPLGYALDKTTYTIVITPTYNELTGELKNYTVRVNGATGNSITFTHEKLDNGTINTTDNAANADTFGINNTPLITLPETGGAGMIALTVAAVVLMAGFGTMFVSLRKRKQVK